MVRLPREARPGSEDPSWEARSQGTAAETGWHGGRPLAVPTRSHAQRKIGARCLSLRPAALEPRKSGLEPTGCGGIWVQSTGSPLAFPQPAGSRGWSPAAPSTPAARGGPAAGHARLLRLSTLGGTGTRGPPLPFPCRGRDRGPGPLPAPQPARRSPGIQANPAPRAHRARAVRRPGLTA